MLAVAHNLLSMNTRRQLGLVNDNKSKSMESLFRIRLKLPGSQCTFRASHASLRSCSFSTALMEFPIWYSSTFIFHNFKVYKLHVQLFLAKIVILS